MSLHNTVIDSLQKRKENNTPFQHWSINDLLPQNYIDRIINDIPIPDTQKIHDGTRAGDTTFKDGKNTSSRMFITRKIIMQHPFLQELIDVFLHSETVTLIKECFFSTHEKLFFRAECTFDHNGFYLAPHEDIKEKVFTLFLYLGDSPEYCGTDLYDNHKNLVKTIPFKNNTGYIFVPGKNTWHGFEPKAFTGVRRALLLNYVTFETEWAVSL